MNEGEQAAYDFIQAMTQEFGKCEFIAKGSLGVVVKTPNFVNKKYIEIVPHVAKKDKK